MGTYTVTTITELVSKIASNSWTDSVNTIYVEPDNEDKILDFNNEDYYYHTGNFLPIKDYAGSNANETIIIDFKGSTLSNIYVYPSSSFLYYRHNYQYGNNGRWFTFMNGTFEAVLNKAYFANIIAAYSSNANYTNTVFKNCVFNLKVNGSNTYNTLFLLGGNSIQFINCVFNIDIVNCSGDSIIRAIGTSAGDTQSAANVYIYSCEFRFKLRDKTSLNSIINFGNNANVRYNINDNIVFFDYYFPFESGDTKADIKHIKSTYEWGLNANSSYSNNFFASLDTDKEIAINLEQGDGKLVNGSTYFIDSDKLSSVAYSGTTCVSLSTAQCKDAAALAAAGYVCAVEG